MIKNNNHPPTVLMANDPIILSVAVLGAVLVLQQSLRTVQAAAGAFSAFAPSIHRSHINQNGAVFGNGHNVSVGVVFPAGSQKNNSDDTFGCQKLTLTCCVRN